MQQRMHSLAHCACQVGVELLSRRPKNCVVALVMKRSRRNPTALRWEWKLILCCVGCISLSLALVGEIV